MKTNGLKPVIGVTTKLDLDGMVRKGIEYSLIRREYGEQLRLAGASPIFLDDTIDPEIAAELCDGIIISGGEDINPEFYGSTPKYLGLVEPGQRTLWEQKLIEACDMRGVRILGICYGMQLLNIYYGGTLSQDINIETGSTLDHGKSECASMHTVTFEKDFLGFAKSTEVETASRHHQAVKDLGRGVEIAGIAEDGTIEALSVNGHHGVQWHAEADGTAAQIYGEYLQLIKQDTLDANGEYAGQPVLKPGIA